MTNVPLPLISAPGRHPEASGGRLVNCYPEKLSPTAGAQLIYPRVPGLVKFVDTGAANFRGSIFVNGVLYVVMGSQVLAYTQAGVVTAFTGSVPGTTAPVFISRNNSNPPGIVIVSPGAGAVILDTTINAVSAYPPGSGSGVVGTPNAVDFIKGFFIFTYGDGSTQASDVNSYNINSLNFANAESKPDTLYRPMPLGNGQLLLAGSNSIEVWGGANQTGYPFNYVATINRGIIGPYAMAGSTDGFGKGLFFVSDDLKTYTLNGYTPQVISSTDVDLRVEKEANKQNIRVGVYVANGHGFVAVQGSGWCWEYETDAGTWHERESYLQSYWRGTMPILAWNQWYCGDYLSGQVLRIDGTVEDELGNPLHKRIETGAFGSFPNVIRINEVELYCTKGTGIATGKVGVQINPTLSISMSKDGGQTWSNPRILRFGQQSLTAQRLRSGIWGHAEVQGVRWRIEETANVPWSLMAIDMISDQLR